MKEALSSLTNLTFAESLRNSWVGNYLRNPRLLWLLLLLIIIVGTVSFVSLPRRLNPEIKIPLVIISTALPGAGPDDIEQLVTVPIEDSVNGLADLVTVTSTSRDSISVVQLEFNSGIDPEKARIDVQSAVDSVSLPEDAQDPFVQDLDFENQPVMIFTVTGRGDTASLIRFAENLRDDIDAIPTIDDVTVSGIDEQEIQIIIKPESISSLGINPMQLSQSIRTAISSYPAGTVETADSSFTLTIDPTVASVEELRELQVSINNNPVALGDVATVQLKAKPGQRTTYYANNEIRSEKSVSISVYKTSSADITKAAENVEKVIEEELAVFPDQFAIQTVFNSAEEITDQFNELLRDFLITIVLVFITLFIFLGARQAVVASLSAPLTFLISFIVMNVTGITLNFISMFSLLLSLGLLVDDTIVVISAMTAYHRTGRFTPVETGLLVWRDFLIPIFTTTITTVWAFIPLLLASGIIGEFIKPIPIVVSATLLASFFVAMFINLPLIVYLLKPDMPRRVGIFLRILLVILLLGLFIAIVPKGPILILELAALGVFIFIVHIVRVYLLRRVKDRATGNKHTAKLLKNAPRFADDGIIHFDIITRRYRNLIRKILGEQKLRRLVVTMVIIFSLFSYFLVPIGFVKNEFFPGADSNTLYLSIQLPAGTNSTVSEKEAQEILEEVRSLKELEFATANIGQTYDPTSGIRESENSNILITLTLLPEHDRDKSSMDLARDLRTSFGDYQKGTLLVVEQSGGPPAGADLQIELSGDDLTTLNTYADSVATYLQNMEGTANVEKSIKPGTSKLVFIPDQEKLATSTLTQDQIGLWMRLFASGVPADSVTFGGKSGDETDVTIRLSPSLQTPESISELVIPGMNGNATSLMEVGNLTVASNPTLITRTDSKRTITITASVEGGFTTSELNRRLEQFADTDLNLPEGYAWKTGGVNEENQNSVNSILVAMILSFLLIIVTMVLQFSSFRKALIVMLVIPLSISGVFIIFALTQTPLSFPALIGVLALFGIVVKNSILIVDKISHNENAGMDFREGIVDGAASRLEAIALTSMTAIIGLIPITLSDPLWRGLGGAIIAGLTFSGTIMLFFIPIVYYYWFHPSEKRKTPQARARRK